MRCDAACRVHSGAKQLIQLKHTVKLNSINLKHPVCGQPVEQLKQPEHAVKYGLQLVIERPGYGLADYDADHHDPDHQYQHQRQLDRRLHRAFGERLLPAADQRRLAHQAEQL